ncbi:hypothetical protein BFN03_01520 [Rhodococcus sp. WMMA185]|uniref:hypothetical protein n=1 Tax=Rhodococcus sp. WMMA185 TaxID=679318 RepID=UPI0008786437|nr:hypothetical protein [Rhodococcus sp. WMMA185]AOW91816.1 hypothetical protein BFN03_01520 [Rhodococcus sp. WMMA185]
MKLRINQLSTAPPQIDLPDDLTGHAVTLDLSHSGDRDKAALSELISEIRSRGAARIVIADSPHEREGRTAA